MFKSWFDSHKICFVLVLAIMEVVFTGPPIGRGKKYFQFSGRTGNAFNTYISFYGIALFISLCHKKPEYN